MIAAAGMTIQNWSNKIDQSVEFFRSILEKIRLNGLPPLGIHLLMGATAEQKLANYIDGMVAGSLSVVLGSAVSNK